jgi:hypothetical protein
LQVVEVVEDIVMKPLLVDPAVLVEVELEVVQVVQLHLELIQLAVVVVEQKILHQNQ